MDLRDFYLITQLVWNKENSCKNNEWYLKGIELSFRAKNAVVRVESN